MARPLFPEVKVNGRVIPQAAIAAEAQNHAAPAGKPGRAWQAAARALVIRRLMLDEAARRGLAPEPRELGSGRRETDDEAMLRLLLEGAVEAAPPAEDQVRAVYDADPERFRSPVLYEASHILYPCPPGDDAVRAAALDRAARTIATLDRDPGAFERIARAESACSSRSAGGRLGQIAPGDTAPEFEAALAALAPGEVAPRPVATRYGLHVVRLDARAEGRVLPFESVRPRIAEALQRRAWTRSARAFAEALVAGAEVTGVAFDARPAPRDARAPCPD